jgi:hypothetical protein
VNEESPTKLPWLRLQPLRMSPWLYGVIFIEFLVFMLPPIGFEWARNGHDLAKAFFTVNWRHATGFPSAVEIALTILLALPLLWFTYFSNNKHVKEGDKFAVFLMFCGAGIGLIVMVSRYIFHLH